MRTPGGFAFPVGAALAVAVTFAAVAIGARSQPVLSVVGMVAVVGFIAVISTAAATLATATLCWCLHSAFVLGSLGELTFTVQSGHDALVIGGCALLGALLVSTARAAVAPLHERGYDPRVPVIPEQPRVRATLTAVK